MFNNYIYSHWQFNHLFALADALEVVVQEVYVQTGLKHSRENLSPAVEIIKVVSVYPIENVEESVESECGDIVRGDVFDEPDLVEHDDLGNERDGLEPETEAPDELPRRPARVYDPREHQGSRQQHLQVGEVVTQGVVSLYK